MAWLTRAGLAGGRVESESASGLAITIGGLSSARTLSPYLRAVTVGTLLNAV